MIFADKQSPRGYPPGGLLSSGRHLGNRYGTASISKENNSVFFFILYGAIFTCLTTSLKNANFFPVEKQVVGSLYLSQIAHVQSIVGFKRCSSLIWKGLALFHPLARQVHIIPLVCIRTVLHLLAPSKRKINTIDHIQTKDIMAEFENHRVAPKKNHGGCLDNEKISRYSFMKSHSPKNYYRSCCTYCTLL